MPVNSAFSLSCTGGVGRLGPHLMSLCGLPNDDREAVLNVICTLGRALAEA
jgi:hypothetical protein